MQLLQGIFKRGSQLQEIEVRMISKSFNLLSTILSWPFDDYCTYNFSPGLIYQISVILPSTLNLENL
jgi:hypothetical protein